jgi:hypothetical protein
VPETLSLVYAAVNAELNRFNIVQFVRERLARCRAGCRFPRSMQPSPEHRCTDMHMSAGVMYRPNIETSRMECRHDGGAEGEADDMGGQGVPDRDDGAYQLHLANIAWQY